MSNHIMSSVYAVRIPSFMSAVIAEYNKVLTLDIFLSLPKMLGYFSQADVFNFVYQQTADPGFLKFMTDNKLLSILTLEENRQWLSLLNEEYTRYCTLREQQDKVNHVANPVVRLVHNAHTYSGADRNNQVLYFTSSEGKVLTPEERIAFKLNVLKGLHLCLGFDGARHHPLARYALTIGDSQ